MKYTANQYASALFEALNESPKERKEILGRFYGVLSRDRKTNLADQILRKVELIFRQKNKVDRVVVESVAGISEKTKSQIKAILGGDAIIQEKNNPSLVGGVKIFVNDEILIDATLKKQIDNLFHLE